MMVHRGFNSEVTLIEVILVHNLGQAIQCLETVEELPVVLEQTHIILGNMLQFMNM